jgi:hypothetical protein
MFQGLAIMFDEYKEYPGWESYVVPQRDKYGCIPTGCEILLRAAKAEDIYPKIYDEFQEKFDCRSDKQPNGVDTVPNDFDTVPNKIKEKYPDINFKREPSEKHDKFTGKDKLNEIEKLFKDNIFTLISFHIPPYPPKDAPKGTPRAYHTMPIIAMDKHNLILFNTPNEIEGFNPHKHLMLLPKNTLVWIHDNHEGGNDILYLEKIKRSETIR